MDPQELNKIIEAAVKELIGESPLYKWWFYLILLFVNIVVTLVISYFYSYLRKKGENLATKQDIGEITKTVEQIRSNITGHQQLRMAALDRRLDIHQRAYKLWTELVSADIRNKGEIQAKSEECQNWWYENNLYLEPKVREAFKKAYMAAFHHPLFIEQRLSSEEIKDNWSKVHKLGKIIEEAITLPEITETEEE